MARRRHGPKRLDALRQGLIESLGRAGLTLLIISVLLLASIFPFKFGNFGQIRPFFLLTAVYYWAVYRPSMLPPIPAFLSGLALDILSGLPMGMNALVVMLVQMTTRAQAKFLLAQKFAVVWACFALVALMAALAQWLLFSLLTLQWAALQPSLVSAGLTVLIFPAMVVPLYAINRALETRMFFG